MLSNSNSCPPQSSVKSKGRVTGKESRRLVSPLADRTNLTSQPIKQHELKANIRTPDDFVAFDSQGRPISLTSPQMEYVRELMEEKNEVCSGSIIFSCLQI
jgi:hypothetical protein